VNIDEDVINTEVIYVHEKETIVLDGVAKTKITYTTENGVSDELEINSNNTKILKNENMLLTKINNKWIAYLPTSNNEIEFRKEFEDEMCDIKEELTNPSIGYYFQMILVLLPFINSIILFLIHRDCTNKWIIENYGEEKGNFLVFLFISLVINIAFIVKDWDWYKPWILILMSIILGILTIYIKSKFYKELRRLTLAIKIEVRKNLNNSRELIKRSGVK